MLSLTSKSLLLLGARCSSRWGLCPPHPPPWCCGRCLQREVLASPFLPWPQCQGGEDARLRFLLTPQSPKEDSSAVAFSPSSEMSFSPCRASSRLLHWLTGRRGANDSDEDEGLISTGRRGKREKRERAFHCNKIDTTSPRQSRSAASPSSPASCAPCLTPEDKWGLGSVCEVQRGTALLKASVNKCLEV